MIPSRTASADSVVPKKGVTCYRECPSGALYGPWAGFGVLGDKLKGKSQNEIKNRSIQRDHEEKGDYS